MSVTRYENNKSNCLLLYASLVKLLCMETKYSSESATEPRNPESENKKLIPVIQTIDVRLAIC